MNLDCQTDRLYIETAMMNRISVSLGGSSRPSTCQEGLAGLKQKQLRGTMPMLGHSVPFSRVPHLRSLAQSLHMDERTMRAHAHLELGLLDASLGSPLHARLQLRLGIFQHGAVQLAHVLIISHGARYGCVEVLRSAAHTFGMSLLGESQSQQLVRLCRIGSASSVDLGVRRLKLETKLQPVRRRWVRPHLLVTARWGFHGSVRVQGSGFGLHASPE